MIAEMLERVVREFVFERGKPFHDNELARYIRRDLTLEGRRFCTFRDEEYIVKASPGSGNWASVPWLGFFDPLITESAQRGFYVVFLVNPDSQKTYLSLNQGTTQVYKEFGSKAYLDVLRRRAADIRARVSDVSSRYDLADIDLGSQETLPAGYMAGHALGCQYSLGELNEANLTRDLNAMLNLYQVLISRGGVIPSDVMFEEAGKDDIEECRQYILSRRIERSRKVRQQVLSGRELTCDACKLDPQKDYGFQGHLENIPLDVHHLVPLNILQEGEKKRYRIPDDFAVLCPNCHRVAHQLDDPSDMENLKNKVRFRYMREMI